MFFFSCLLCFLCFLVVIFSLAGCPAVVEDDDDGEIIPTMTNCNDNRFDTEVDANVQTPMMATLNVKQERQRK